MIDRALTVRERLVLRDALDILRSRKVMVLWPDLNGEVVVSLKGAVTSGRSPDNLGTAVEKAK